MIRGEGRGAKALPIAEWQRVQSGNRQLEIGNKKTADVFSHVRRGLWVPACSHGSDRPEMRGLFQVSRADRNGDHAEFLFTFLPVNSTYSTDASLATTTMPANCAKLRQGHYCPRFVLLSRRRTVGAMQLTPALAKVSVRAVKVTRHNAVARSCLLMEPLRSRSCKNCTARLSLG